MIALTFDDGPSSEWTPPILDALARAGAHATFFPLSPRAAAHPAIMRRIAEEGHLIGLHGWAHLKHPEYPRSVVAADTELALSVLDRVDWWRFPYGMEAAFSRDLAAAHGLRVAGWTHDTHDWAGGSAEEMAFAPAADEVVLMHDGLGPGRRRESCAETVRLTERLVLEHGSVRLDALAAVPDSRPG